MKTAIDICKVTKTFGTFTALHSVSMSIMDNEFFTLLGPSGCGKTTLLKANPTFPKPVRLSPGCTRWRISDIEAWESAKAKPARN